MTKYTMSWLKGRINESETQKNVEEWVMKNEQISHKHNTN